MNRNPLIDEQIAEVWRTFERDAGTRGQHAYSGRLCRLDWWKAESQRLSLGFGPTDFRELLGTNRNKNVVADSLEAKYRSNATGVCSVVAGTDGKMIIQRRRDDAIQAPGHLHVCGGMLEPEVAAGQVRVDPFEHMAKELTEELGIRPEDISETWCLGLVEDQQTLQPEVVFETRLNVEAERFAGAPGPEHKEIVVVDDAAEPLQDFLVSNRGEIVPVGFGCLVLYGRRRFGERWFEKIVSPIA